jgi:long-chain acyl-CoA synthetase
VTGAPAPAVAPDAGDTLPKLVIANARRFPNKVALREKEFGLWQPITWGAYHRRVRNFSLGLGRLGVERGDRVAIVGDNRPEWVIAELATQAGGGLSIGVYQDSVAEEVQYILEVSEAQVVVAEDQEQVDKILRVRDRLPGLKHIVYYDPRGLSTYDEPMLVPFPAVEAMGEERGRRDEGAFEQQVGATAATDVALLCTTSGTTSEPKLAMLTHDNLLSMARQLLHVDPMNADDEFVSFLPLAWIGEQMVSLSCALLVGFTINFPEATGTVQQNLREIGPHVMFAPPRIWENMVSDVQVKIEDAPLLKRRIFDWAMSVGEAAADARFEKRNGSKTLRWKRVFAEWLAMLPIKDQLGLRHLRRAYTGGAALGPDVFRFYHALGVSLKQIYGQTEVSGISVLHRDDDIKFQTVGVPLPDTDVRIAADGEILTRSRAVFAGYYRDVSATEEALKDGWLHSGDAGYVDSEGHLVVVDRAKDVMKLSDGTSFSPQFIENKLKFSPYIREAVVFGDERAFVAAIIAIDYGNTGKWAEKGGIAYTTFTDLAQKEPIYRLVREQVARTNVDLPDAARIRRFLLLHKELDADDAELTRTRKVRRRFVAERYETLLAGLYGDVDAVSVEVTIALQDGRSTMVHTDLRIETLS